MLEDPINEGYYETLKNKSIDYPNPAFEQIEVDLPRTFTDMNDTDSEALLPSLRNVLFAFVSRNP